MTEETRTVSGWKKRRPVRPKWGGRHGTVVKGSVTWNGTAHEVVFSFLLGYETTMRAKDYYANWSTAMSEYRQHDRTVRERKQLEDYRAVRAVL